MRDTLKWLRTEPPQNWTMLPTFTFTARELSQWSGADLGLVESVLAAFSLPVGNVNAEFESLSDFNAANAAPLLRREDNQIVLFQHYSLLEALYEVPFFWMADDPKYFPTASRHRGSFTEQFSRECLERVFGCHVYPNVDIVRKKGEKIGEIDVLIYFGHRAILLHAKSKRLTLRARKGNDFQIKDDFKSDRPGCV